jgi:UDP-N-acetylglucosamine--N-acetylmuramyl-(pentapeptide) pyrophosphoryl-undecaprenol N-acetylglucosamine transferase
MKKADVIVCRGGATTIAEFTAAGRAAILIPLPTAADDHQRRNAEVLAAAGAADLLEQAQMSGETLAHRIIGLAAEPSRRHAMSGAARQLAKPDAAKAIVDRAFELLERR